MKEEDSKLFPKGFWERIFDRLIIANITANRH